MEAKKKTTKIKNKNDKNPKKSAYIPHPIEKFKGVGSGLGDGLEFQKKVRKEWG